MMAAMRIALRSIMVAALSAGLTYAALPWIAGMSGDQAAAAGRPLRLCIDVVGVEVDRVQARSRIEQVMRSQVERHPQFARVGFQPGAWTVDAGCPSEPALLRSGERHPKNGGRQTWDGLVTVPSGYAGFIFVVPQAEIRRMFGDLPFHVYGQEVMCKRGSCGDVSNAIYVSPELLARAAGPDGAADLAQDLVHVIGLEPPSR